jgi:hypothetical protein
VQEISHQALETLRKSFEPLVKKARQQALTDQDYEKDTNFGKLKRIPYPPLQKFLGKHGAI